MPSSLRNLVLVLAMAFLPVVSLHGFLATAQATLNGLVAAGYIGLGAIGLTLALSTLKVINLAHGDLLVVGAYGTALGLALGLPLLLAGALAVVGTAVVALASDRLVWRPLRRAGAGTYQLLLSTVGLSLVLRYLVQFAAGGDPRTLGHDGLTTLTFGGLIIGRLQLLLLAGGIVTMMAVTVLLLFTPIGRQMRAVADNPDLSEISGISKDRIADLTWLAAGGLAGLAGIFYALAAGSFAPGTGSALLFSLFAASVLGGTGSAAGALAGGLVISVLQEWASLVFGARWKPAAGLIILIALLALMPNGLFGRAAPRP